MRLVVLAIIAIWAVPAPGSEAAEYPLGQVALHRPLPDTLRPGYLCRPRNELAGTNHCVANKTSDRQPSAIRDLITDTANGGVLYARSADRQAGTITAVEKRVVAEMTAALGGAAPKRFSIDNALAAVWGDVRLEKISAYADEYADIKDFVEQRYGLLVSTVETFEAAKKDDRPVYRVAGGDGMLVIVSKTDANQVLVQRITAAGATLAERNFLSEARRFLREDRAAAGDVSRWADVAYMVRRLALNTTPENANRLLDEAFAADQDRKYRSHVWAVLPTSVITHLKNGTYRAADIFGEKSEFPGIRKKMIELTTLEPSAPFSEFLLYALGRLDEAAQLNSASPIRTTLTYAAGHAGLRQCLASVFAKISKAGDLVMLTDNIVPKSYIDDIDEEDLTTQYGVETFTTKNANYKAIQRKIDDYDKRLKTLGREPSVAERDAALSRQNFFTDHAYEAIASSHDDYRDGKPSLSQYITYFNQFPERYNSRPLIESLPEFRALCDGALSHFNEVAKDQTSLHHDDAAYFSAWLEYHRGNVSEALSRFALSIAVPKPDAAAPSDSTNAAYIAAPKPDAAGTAVGPDAATTEATGAEAPEDEPSAADLRDYRGAALQQVARILRMLAPEDALARVQRSDVFSQNSMLWYTVLTSMYHANQYQSVVDHGRIALKRFGIAIESYPVTTDPERIGDALTKNNLNDYDSWADIIYLYQAAREALRLEATVSSADRTSPAAISEQVRGLVTKYMRTHDEREDQPARPGPKASHRDLRQGLYLAQRSLELLPRRAEYNRLREWLHYKRITVLAQFDPVGVGAAAQLFEAEFPASSLLDDAAAEQVFAEAVVMRDMARAGKTFDVVRQRFPAANAVDNAYSWMAIGWTCAGQPAKARDINREIVRRFPLTRHARFARERLRQSNGCADLLYLYNWDYRAMTWRERNRISTIQANLRNPQR